MPPGKPATINGHPIYATRPGPGTGDTLHYTREAVWITGPTATTMLAQPLPTGGQRSEIKR